MSKFDLDAAIGGEAVQALNPKTNQWEDAHFVGVSKNIFLVVMELEHEFIGFYGHQLRMKPKRREMWCFPLIRNGALVMSNLYKSSEEAGRNLGEIHEYGDRPLGDAQMILVDEE